MNSQGTASDLSETEGSALGRPRSGEADAAIAAAAVELFAERGFEGVSIEAVAARAGVARSTVYRRYSGKAELLASAMRLLAQEISDVPDTGSLVDDLHAVVTRLDRVILCSDLGRAIPATLVAAERHDEFARLHREFVLDKRELSLAVVRRGIARGEVAADTDPEAMIDVVVGPLFYRRLISHGPVDDAWRRALVERAVRAFAP